MDHPELRQNLTTKEWVILASGRSKRPHQFSSKKSKRLRVSKKDCPFESLKISEFPSLIYYNKDRSDWKLQIIPNKYPLLRHSDVCSVINEVGPYKRSTGVGHHDVVVTRDHDKNFPKLSPHDALLVFKSFKERYKTMIQDECVSYFFAFHNWGPKAGASIYHPHYQIIVLPIIPIEVYRSLLGSRKYFEKNKKCAHCVMMKWERQKKERIIFENEHAISYAPYASRFPFELRVFPKKHNPYFEDASDVAMKGVVSVLQKTLRALEKKVGDPDYNFFIHTAPIKNKDSYGHYHWHIEILTKLTKMAAIEIGTGIEVNIVRPADAAKLLRSR